MIALTLCTVLIFFLSAVYCPSAGAAPIRIAYSSISAAMLPLFVAKDKKLFDKYGVDVELTYIRGVRDRARVRAGKFQQNESLAK